MKVKEERMKVFFKLRSFAPLLRGIIIKMQNGYEFLKVLRSMFATKPECVTNCSLELPNYILNRS